MCWKNYRASSIFDVQFYRLKLTILWYLYGLLTHIQSSCRPICITRLRLLSTNFDSHYSLRQKLNHVNDAKDKFCSSFELYSLYYVMRKCQIKSNSARIQIFTGLKYVQIYSAFRNSYPCLNRYYGTNDCIFLQNFKNRLEL